MRTTLACLMLASAMTAMPVIASQAASNSGNGNGNGNTGTNNGNNNGNSNTGSGQGNNNGNNNSGSNLGNGFGNSNAGNDQGNDQSNAGTPAMIGAGNMPASARSAQPNWWRNHKIRKPGTHAKPPGP
jgi:hypothetical protein